MSVPQQNEALIRRYFAYVWNRGEVDLLDELLTDDYVNHTPRTESQPTDRNGLKDLVRTLRGAFADLEYEVLRVVCQEDAVAVHTIMHGTHSGALFGLPPTGRHVAVAQMQIEQIRDGRICAHWRVAEDLMAALTRPK